MGIQNLGTQWNQRHFLRFWHISRLTLVETDERKQRRPSLESTLTPVPTKLVTVQSTPTDNVRKDGIGNFPDWGKKRGRCRQCLHGYTYISCRKCNVWLCFNKNRIFLVHTMDISKRRKIIIISVKKSFSFFCFL